MKNPEFSSQLRASGRKTVIVVGIETHICVSQTCLDLLDAGYAVAVCPDAASARTQDRHKLGMERLRDAGVVPIHTEALVYEWMVSANHPQFRDILQVVKSSHF
jgi:nicotinamidase-related amidase